MSQKDINKFFKNSWTEANKNPANSSSFTFTPNIPVVPFKLFCDTHILHIRREIPHDFFGFCKALFFLLYFINWLKGAYVSAIKTKGHQH